MRARLQPGRDVAAPNHGLPLGIDPRLAFVDVLAAFQGLQHGVVMASHLEQPEGEVAGCFFFLFSCLGLLTLSRPAGGNAVSSRLGGA